MIKAFPIYGIFCWLILCCFASCTSIHLIEKMPADTYTVTEHRFATTPDQPSGHNNKLTKFEANIEQTDSVLKITPVSTAKPSYSVKLDDIYQLKMHRSTFDVDVLTVPFKIRPSVQGFPQQLNANFNGALYFGRRRDSYTIKASKAQKKTITTGVGYGFGGFIGLGSTTMNPYVTQQAIDYEYDGFVVNGGIAAIYDAKRFNLGLALGTDLLMDKNRRHWIYQGKPWIGVLFGIDLN